MTDYDGTTDEEPRCRGTTSTKTVSQLCRTQNTVTISATLFTTETPTISTQHTNWESEQFQSEPGRVPPQSATFMSPAHTLKQPPEFGYRLHELSVQNEVAQIITLHVVESEIELAIFIISQR